MVKDHGRAEDVTQEVFVSALRRMRETERPIAFKPWIYEIAKNACIDQFRRSRRTEEISFDAGEGLAPSDYGRLVSPEPVPDAALAAKQEPEQVVGAFGGLSDAHHEILALRELEDMYADPPAHKWRRLTNADLGRPGCTTYHVRPRAGLLGMLMGWWVVKISGGCP